MRVRREAERKDGVERSRCSAVILLRESTLIIRGQIIVLG